MRRARGAGLPGGAADYRHTLGARGICERLITRAISTSRLHATRPKFPRSILCRFARDTRKTTGQKIISRAGLVLPWHREIRRPAIPSHSGAEARDDRGQYAHPTIPHRLRFWMLMMRPNCVAKMARRERPTGARRYNPQFQVSRFLSPSAG